MSWDLIVVGGGPGGLMAARTAAENGINVLLVERRREIARIKRACSQIFFIDKLTASEKSERGEGHINGYVEPVSLEVRDDRVRLHFLGPGFHLDYHGPVSPYYDWIQVSPSGYQVHRYDRGAGKIWAYNYSKTALLLELLAAAEKAGVEVRTETSALAAQDDGAGVSVRLSGKTREETLTARKLIAADGLHSRVVESLGMNRDRPPLGKPLKIAHYIVEGLEGQPPNSWISFTVPSITPWGTMPIGLWDGEMNQVEAGSLSAVPPHQYLESFMKSPLVASWFRRARVVEKLACSSVLRQPLRNPAVGNVIAIGDSAAPDATWIQGAIACGFQAAKAIGKDLAGAGGSQEYTAWWQSAFAFNRQDHFKTFDMAYSLTRLCSAEEVDYIYKLFQDRVGIPPCLVNKNMDLVRRDRPALFEKLSKVLGERHDS